MKNYRLSTVACLFGLLAAGNALADDRNTNGVPTALLEYYVSGASDQVLAEGRGTSAIPTAILELFSSAAAGQALAEDLDTNAIPTALLERYIGPNVSPLERSVVAHEIAMFHAMAKTATSAQPNIADPVHSKQTELIVGSTSPILKAGDNGVVK